MKINEPIAIGGTPTFGESPYNKVVDQDTLWTIKSTDVPILIRGSGTAGRTLDWTTLGQEEHAVYIGTCSQEYEIATDDRIKDESGVEYKVTRSYLSASREFRQIELRLLP